MKDPAAPAAPRRAAGAVLGIAVVAACGLAGFLAHRLMTPARPSLYPIPAVSAPAVPPSPTPAEPAPVTRTIAEDVPPIKLPGLDGVPRTLADYRGKLLLVNFWATWCEPCRREIPLLKTLRHERAKDGFEVVGIAVDHRDSVEKYARERGIDYPLLVGEQGGLEAVNAFGMDTVLPFSVFADRDGRIVTLKVGELHGDEARLILDRMTDLDQGRLTLAAAREKIASGVARLGAARAAGARGEN